MLVTSFALLLVVTALSVLGESILAGALWLLARPLLPARFRRIAPATRRRLLSAFLVGGVIVAALTSLLGRGSPFKSQGLYMAAFPAAYLLNLAPRSAFALLPDLAVSLVALAASASCWAFVVLAVGKVFAVVRQAAVA